MLYFFVIQYILSLTNNQLPDKRQKINFSDSSMPEYVYIYLYWFKTSTKKNL